MKAKKKTSITIDPLVDKFARLYAEDIGLSLSEIVEAYLKNILISKYSVNENSKDIKEYNDLINRLKKQHKELGGFKE